MSDPAAPQPQGPIPSTLFDRKVGLVVSNANGSPGPGGAAGLDLSAMHIRFHVEQSDFESPNNARIRVYNLSDATAKQVQGEFNRVTLSAGYAGGPYGIIFQGTMMQFRRGKENNVTTYLEILAADGDTFYNFGTVNQSLPLGSSAAQRAKVLTTAAGAPPPITGADGLFGGTLPRGKVLYGMFRDQMRTLARSNGATWSIQDGQVQVIQLQDYLPSQAVVLNSQTGLIGIPEQTEQGVEARVLINPKLRVGALVQINNSLINQTVNANPNQPVPFNRYTGLQLLARTTEDGLYRLYSSEHSGDSRGQEWYSDLILLAIDKSKSVVLAQ